MSNIEDIVKEETQKLLSELDGQITDPDTRLAIARMTTDLAMLPIRMARGEDVSQISASLKAEAMLRGVSTSLKAQKTMQQAWTNIVLRIVTAALLAT